MLIANQTTPQRACPTGGPHWHSEIKGRVRLITTHQLIVAWWLHTEGHLTRRQLRVYFALHEMHERRMFVRQDGQTRRCKPSYGVEELRPLIGRATPLTELRADVRAVARVGLADMTERGIHFATSIEQITLPPAQGHKVIRSSGHKVIGSDDRCEQFDGFWAMLNAVPEVNRRRTVPVPRRTLRALAGGFSRGTTAVMLALLIRCLFRHASEGGRGTNRGGRYRVDGRTKGSWIAETFGVSRRAVTEGRSRLIELGWITPIETPQLALNKWGNHDRLNPDWQPEPETPSDVPEHAQTKRGGPNLPALTPKSGVESASPYNQNTSSENLNQNARPERADTGPGACQQGRGGDNAVVTSTSNRPPRLRDIQSHDLRDNRRLIELHRQAHEAGRWGDSEADKLDFFALAERARAQAEKPAAMFAWLIAKNKRGHITQSDEDRAIERLRELRSGSRRVRNPNPPVLKPKPVELDETGKLVQACLKVAQQRRIADPFHVLKTVKPEWSRQQWEEAVMAYQHADLQRWHEVPAA